MEANQAGYEVGTRTIVDVLNAERDVYLAEANYAQARYSYIANYLILRQAAGQLSEADLAEINGWLGEPRPTSGATPVSTAPASREPAKAGSGKGKNGKSAAAKSTDKPSTTPAIPSAAK